MTVDGDDVSTFEHLWLSVEIPPLVQHYLHVHLCLCCVGMAPLCHSHLNNKTESKTV